jgi:hypothetical protein
MNCHAAGELLNGWIDGQLPADDASALEDHLSVCAECRSLAEGLRIQDAELRRAFQPRRQAAQQVASRVLAALDQDSRPSPPRLTHSLRFGWGALLLAAAAGFLLAVILLQPWKRQPLAFQPRNTSPVPQDEPPISQPPVAHLVVATGDVEMRSSPATDWQAFPALKTFTCPSGSEVRTGDDVRCELETTGGCVIRLNEGTEIAIGSPTSVTIRRGQLWCSSPENVSLKIVAPQAEAKPAEKQIPAWTYACPSSSCLLTAQQADGDVQVLTSTGETELQTPRGSQRLKPGQRAAVVNGQIVKSPGEFDPILEAGWVHALLVRKGSNDAELARRIDALLSQLGRGKDERYEQQIRGLGEYAVPSLLRIVQSPQSKAEPESQRRLTAMRLASELAPSWAVPELIGLLADDDPEVRFFAATALLRLTGLDQGRPPDQWREGAEKCSEALQRWQKWLASKRDQYPPPPISGATRARSPPAI